MPNDRVGRLKDTVKEEIKSSIEDEFKNAVKELLLRASGSISTYFAALTLGAYVWLPASIATASLIFLWRMGWIKKHISQERFLEEVENEIILLTNKIEEREKTKQNLEKALGEASEDVKYRIENELKAENDRLRILKERRIYLETLQSTLNTIKILEYKYGEQVKQVYRKIIDLAIKIENGTIKDEKIDKELKKLIDMREKSPEFPYVIREVIEEMLLQT
jgi:septal ring factor EnvC (AmiA/AmiB activator)